MKIRNLMSWVLAALILGGATAMAADAVKKPSRPKAVFRDTILTFPTVVDGVVITREFRVENVGSADLWIDKVKTG